MCKSEEQIEQWQTGTLCGKPIPTVRFHGDAGQWERYRKFSFKADNPYRMQEAPQAAPFLQDQISSASWLQRQAAVVKRERPVQGLETEKDLYAGAKDSSFAWEFDHVFTGEQCLELIEMANRKGFVPALANNQRRYETGDPRKGDELEFDPERRDTCIAMYDSPELSKYIFQVLEPHLKNAPLPNGWQLDHVNSYMRGLCYFKKDQNHSPHFDAQFAYPKGKYPEPHEWANARSFLTLFVYLSDVPAEAGGATAFPAPMEKLSDESMRVQPRAGRVLMFSQNLYHTGAPLLRDDALKYVIRTEVMCTPCEGAQNAV
jgi:hypothetical protein